jgi:hypothetical protein
MIRPDPPSFFSCMQKTPPEHHQNATIPLPVWGWTSVPSSPFLRFSVSPLPVRGPPFPSLDLRRSALVSLIQYASVRVRPSESPMFTASSTGLRLQPPGVTPPCPALDSRPSALVRLFALFPPYICPKIKCFGLSSPSDRVFGRTALKSMRHPWSGWGERPRELRSAQHLTESLLL